MKDCRADIIGPDGIPRIWSFEWLDCEHCDGVGGFEGFDHANPGETIWLRCDHCNPDPGDL